MKHAVKNPTRSYRPTGTAFVNQWSYFFTSDPWFTWGDVMLMARDPAVKYGLKLLRSPYAKVKIKDIKARPAVARYIETTWTTFMRHSLPKLLNNYFKWGRAPGGVEWEWDTKTETLKLQTVRAIEPLDAIAQVWRDGPKKNQFAGFTLHDMEVKTVIGKPYAFWFSGFNEWGQFCDEPRVACAFAPWLEKTAPMGLRASRRLHNWTKAVGITVVRHPDGMVKQPDGTEIPAENKALQNGAALQNGTIIAMSSAYNEGGNGYKWDVDQRPSSGDGKYLGEAIKDADNEIWVAMGIPPEIVRSGDTGSGYSGRAIPMETWLAGADELSGMINSEFRHQVLEPGMKNSFGRVDYDGYEITSLLEEYLESQKQGGPQQGGQQGQQQPGGSSNSGGSGSRWVPDGISRNGTPRERNESGDRRYVHLSTLDAGDGDEPDQLHDADPQTMHQDKNTLQLRHAVALAMIEAQLQGRGQDTLDALSELADDPDEVGKALGSVSLAWLDYGFSRTGTQRWKDDATGKIRYQKTMPGTARTRSEKRAGTAKQAHDIIGKLLRSEATADHLRELATHLPELTVKELRIARAKLGAKFKDPRTRDRMVQALLAHVEGEQHKLSTQEPAPQPELKNAKPEPAEQPKQPEPEPEPARAASDGAGSPTVHGGDAKDGGPVASEVSRPGDATADQSGQTDSEPASSRVAQRVPAEHEEVTKRLDRLSNFMRYKNPEVAHWLDLVRQHVDEHGVESALESLGNDKEEEAGTAKNRDQTQYEGGWNSISDFANSYLNKHGISLVNTFAWDVEKGSPVVSSSSPSQGGMEPRDENDFTPKDPTLANKLDEAKNLPGLEASEDLNKVMGHKVTHLTPQVIDKLNEQYGHGKWIVKAYGDDAAAGYGIFFPQRAQQIRQDAQNTIWNAGSEIAQYGFKLARDKNNKVIGIEHQGGDLYKFDDPKYQQRIFGDVRHWGDLAEQAAAHEQGAELPGGGHEFMAQPAFNVVGVSEADRAAGKTIAPGEGRVHVVTRNGKAEIVPHSTWIKGEHLPVVFENEETRAMAKAAHEAISKLPESERNGQIYAPDVVKTADGYKVVEANPANHTGSSGYLGDNPFIIDSYVSHMTGRSPAHVRFVRNLLSKRTKGNKDEPGQPTAQPGTNADGTNVTGSARSGTSGGSRVAGNDTRTAGRFDRTKPANGNAPEKFAETLRSSGVKPLSPPPGYDDGTVYRWDQPEHIKKKHNAQILAAAKKSGLLLKPEQLAGITSNPNVGGMEHDVHEDPEHNQFYKFTKDGHFGQNKDVHEYLERHAIANKMWPELGYKFHGFVQDHKGNPQSVLSMNRVEGTHPTQDEVHDFFKKKGWVSNEDEEDLVYGTHSWKDPKTGTVINDAHAKNFIKTKKGLVPIDVDIVPAEKKQK